MAHGLTAAGQALKRAVMLQHNDGQTGKRAHIAHAAMVGLHGLCCGLPALAMLAAAVSGAATSVTLLADFVAPFHAILHQHEIWMLIASAFLVATGGALEAWDRRGPHQHGFPWLFAISAACLVANAAIIVSHRAVG